MIPRLTAAQFHRFMSSGRTRPLLCACENASGDRAGDFIVKPMGGMERGQKGLVSELLASLLAIYFKISTPEPALLTIERDFAELVLRARPAEAGHLRRSIGLNFGSRHLSDANPWPIDQRIPDAMRHAALEIFAFDALIQNPDRRYNNQNLLTRGDEIFVFDHELAFSFLLDVAPSRTPWRLDGQKYLAEHVFYRQLKSKPMDLKRFVAALKRLSGPRLDGILAEVPSEWNNEDLGKIDRHLRTVGDHADEFGEEVRRRLV